MRIEVIDIDTLSRNWWVIALRGVAGILFGIVAFLAPGITIAALVLAFGVYALVDGVLAIVSAIRRRHADERPWWFLFEGIAGILAGVVTLLWPGITALTLLWVIAAWAIVTGVLAIASAIRLRKAISGEWMLALSGIASIVFGVLVMFFPGAGALGLVLLIGAYAIVFGALLLGLGFRLRSRGRTHVHRPAHGMA
jgi:uncharacterized membrane protein HdeD (DUF308 family)